MKTPVVLLAFCAIAAPGWGQGGQQRYRQPDPPSYPVIFGPYRLKSIPWNANLTTVILEPFGEPTVATPEKQDPSFPTGKLVQKARIVDHVGGTVGPVEDVVFQLISTEALAAKTDNWKATFKPLENGKRFVALLSLENGGYRVFAFHEASPKLTHLTVRGGARNAYFAYLTACLPEDNEQQFKDDTTWLSDHMVEQYRVAARAPNLSAGYQTREDLMNKTLTQISQDPEEKAEADRLTKVAERLPIQRKPFASMLAAMWGTPDRFQTAFADLAALKNLPKTKSFDFETFSKLGMYDNHRVITFNEAEKIATDSQQPSLISYTINFAKYGWTKEQCLTVYKAAQKLGLHDRDRTYAFLALQLPGISNGGENAPIGFAPGGIAFGRIINERELQQKYADYFGIPLTQP